MDMVQVARFLDPTEAQVAASALRSGGMLVHLQGEVLGQMDVNLVYAMGGIRLWVPEDEAEDARAFINASRSQPSTLAPLPVAEATVRTTLSFLLTFLMGGVVPLRPRRPERLDESATAD
jgi:hypothetical protein